MANTKYQCPFTSDEKYNKELNGGNGFTIKEMVVDIHKTIRTHDSRINKSEIKIAYIFGGLGVLGIAITLVRFL